MEKVPPKVRKDWNYPLGTADETPPARLLHQRPEPCADRRRRHDHAVRLRDRGRPRARPPRRAGPGADLERCQRARPAARDADLGLPEPLQELHCTDQSLAEVYLPFVQSALDGSPSLPRRWTACCPSRRPRTWSVRRRRRARGRETGGGGRDRWVLALALGGERREVEVCRLDPVATRGRRGRAVVPTRRGAACARTSATGGRCSRLSPAPGRALRSREIRCMVRNEDVARVEGSTLRYPDQGHLPVVDLGGEQAERVDRRARGSRAARARGTTCAAEREPPPPQRRRRIATKWRRGIAAQRRRGRADDARRIRAHGDPDPRAGGGGPATRCHRAGDEQGRRRRCWGWTAAVSGTSRPGGTATTSAITRPTARARSGRWSRRAAGGPSTW